MKKVLITGGCGFVGAALVAELHRRGGYEIDVIDNLSIGKEAKIPFHSNFLGGDIRAMDNIDDKPYVYIFHLAALSRIQPSFQNPHLTFMVNVAGTKQVTAYALRNKSKLIYAGSSSRHHNPMLSPYALTKHMGEEWIKMERNVYGLNAEIARFYNVYGPGELVGSDMAAVIGIWRHAISNGEPILIHGDGEQRRDFTHIDDIVDGLIRIAESDEKHEDAWELGTGCNYSLNELADMFGDIKRKYVDDVKGNYRETIRINNDAIQRLGWQPTDKLKSYINEIKLRNNSL
ncbi:MAG: Vibrio phage vB VchM Kuja [Bacteroidota bacterium]|jgi:UDP-glucose 4-epimerase